MAHVVAFLWQTSKNAWSSGQPAGSEPIRLETLKEHAMSDQKCGCPCESFSPMTLVACGLGFLFVIFLFFEATTIRWWIMLPLALVSFILFNIQRGQTEGAEKAVCGWGYWLIIVLFLLRDMCLSGQVVAAYHRLTAAGIPLHGCY
jgi:hypothetical protein